MADQKRFYVSGVGGPYVVRDRHPFRGGVNGEVESFTKFKAARIFAAWLCANHPDTPRDQLPKFDGVALQVIEEQRVRVRVTLEIAHNGRSVDLILNQVAAGLANRAAFPGVRSTRVEVAKEET